jgi:hypothetical protein
MKRTTALALASLLSSPLLAQLPDWTTFTPNAPSMFFAESSILAVEDATGFHVWSSYTRAYSHLTVGPGRLFYGQDDSCVIVDAATNTAYGYATHLGVFRPLPLNGVPTAPSPNTGATWMVALVDGTDVHFFSGLLGNWTTVHFAAAPTVALGRMVGVATDGARTVAISSHFGTPVELGFGASAVDAVGYCGAARDANYWHVFSAYRNRWRSIPASPTAALIKPPSRAGYVLVQEPVSSTWYSALTDTQAVLFTSPSATRILQANVAAVWENDALFGYSCATGTFAAATTAATWQTVSVQQETIGASDGTDAFALGVLGGTWVQLPGAQIIGVDSGTALAVQTTANLVHAYSCMTNTWVPAPAGTYPTTFTTYNGAILVDAAGNMLGFSANRGTWTAQAAPPADSYYRAKAAFCARAGTRLDAFNGRTGQWATTNTATQATVTVFDFAVMANDGQSLHCIDCYRTAWSSQACASIQRQLRDEMAYGYDGTTVFTWSGSNQVSEWANMPEYWRILARGGRLNFSVAAEPNSLAFVLIGTAPTNLPTPYGLLLVDPNGAVVWPVVIPPFGTAQTHMIVPDQPWLRGLTIWAQAAVATPASSIYRTGEFESTIM